jgi:hypothetical protein
MSTPPNTSNPGPAAAVPVGGQPARRKWLLPLLLGLLALIALLFLLSRCGNDDPATPTAGTSASPTAGPSPAATTATATDSASASASATAGQTGTAQAGTVTSGGDNLLGGAGTAASLRNHDGDEAVGRAVRVQSVPADEGFWVGTSAQDRLWVQLTGTRGESDYKVKEGDTIEFTGTVTPAAKGFAAETGLTAAEGAEQLTTQGYYVAVPASSVKLSS